MTPALMLTNTVTGKKEHFVPLDPCRVTMYVCGVTPYDNAHVGHGRCYVSFDILYRTLQFLDYPVRYCRNITDIDDKIIHKAQNLYHDPMRYTDVAAPYIANFHDDMATLHCLPPDFEPRVTDNIESIIAFIARLIGAGKAYQIDGDVYFSVRDFPRYGRLSKHNIDDLKAGARVDPNEKKRDPLDFALWKREPEGNFWSSPWGFGRPGWHIECSALASHYLGQQIDIHAGGHDLIFPHHENEIAQTEAITGKPFASYWLHNGFIQINHEKMSKSLGNFFTLRDIFSAYNPTVLRFYFLNHQYKAPVDFSLHMLSSAQKTYERITRLLSDIPCDVNESILFSTIKSPVVRAMADILLDDLNTPGLMGILFERWDTIKQDIQTLCEIKLFFHQVLGLPCRELPKQDIVITPEVQELLAEREQARSQKNWAKSDELRDRLRALGYQVNDSKITNIKNS